MAKKKAAGHTAQRALVIGVSDYPDPSDRLPGVAADVREMAKVLSSKDGTFASAGVTVLTDKNATQGRVQAALEDVFDGANGGETVFVYLAGHGAVEGNDYYFVAYDTDASLADTGVPLREIKRLFDGSKARSVFLWLDFCHSGGILARRRAGADYDMAMISRSIGVVQGHGKVIVAACTSTQLAYEDPAVGHGLFTDALLRGLRGEAKSAQGEVTAHSLYEFIDHQVANKKQQPVFFGQTTGRIVLMHYPNRSTTSAKPKSSTKKKATKKLAASSRTSSGPWIMLGEHFIRATSVRHRSDGTISVSLQASTTEQEATLSSLRPSQYGAKEQVPFAVNNDGHVVEVQDVEAETTTSKPVWHLTLRIVETNSAGMWLEMSHRTSDGTVTPDDVARMRVGRILLNDPAPSEGRNQTYDSNVMVESAIEGMNSPYPVRACVIREVYEAHKGSRDWKEFARLRSTFLLKVTGTVEHILELKIGNVRSGQVPVTFRGRRPQRYQNVAAETIEVSGKCPLA